MTIGFVLVFGLVGVVLSAATSIVVRVLPWAGLGIGVLLTFAGGWMLAGGGLYTSLGQQIAQRFGAGAHQANMRGFLAYGLAYGIGSLSCTLPIFLTVVGSTLTVPGMVSGVVQFILYALGMGFVITILTGFAALFKVAAIAKMRALLRYVEPASAILMLVAGAYIVYYWLTLGGLLAAAGRT
jgi:cytochrome c biogenesis protein CcdA